MAELIGIGILAVLAIALDWLFNLRKHRAQRRPVVIWQRSGRSADEIRFSRPSTGA